MLAILTGLEIDSAKSGVKPDLSEYLEARKAKKSLFLQYKSIVGDNSERKWYQPTTAKRVIEFIEKNDWNAVSSNLEKLPYYAYMLDKETLKHKAHPATDDELFAFAQHFQQQRVACVLLRFVLVLVTGRCFYEHKGRYL